MKGPAEPTPYQGFRARDLWALPNILSLARFLLLPAFYGALRASPAGPAWGAAGVLLAAAGTDVLDGLWARRSGHSTALGKILDPVADKVFLGGAAWALAVHRGFPLWLLGLVLLRDGLILLGGAVFLRRHAIVFSANWWGKLAHAALATLALLHVLDWKAPQGPLVAATCGLLVISAGSYARTAGRYLGHLAERAPGSRGGVARRKGG